MIEWRPKVGDLVRFNNWFAKMGLAQYYNAREGDFGVVIELDIDDPMKGSCRVYSSRTMHTDWLHYSYLDRVM